MPSNDMIERVARAIQSEDAERGIYYGIDTNDAARFARATIEAMMEGITPAMLKSMEEMYMPFGEMRAAWDGAFIAALHPIQNGEGE